MNAMNFGDVLRQARERSGEDIISVARRIRIRPDILERIEASDLDAMPPRGYARNMINAYARYLGLNPTELVKMYLNAQYQNQVEKARASIKPSGFDMPTSHRRSHDRSASSNRDYSSASRSRALSSSWDNISRGDDDFLDSQSPMLASPASTTRRAGAVQVESYNAYGQGLSQRQAARSSEITRAIEPVGQGNRSVRRARFSALPEESYGNLYAAPSNLGTNTRNSALSGRLPFIIAGIIILLLVVLIVVLVNGVNRANTANYSSQPINVTGVSSSESTSETDSSEDTTTTEEEDTEEEETAPTETVITYEVSDGEEPYVEIQVDGEYVLASYVSGPASDTFEITGTIEIVASPYDGLTITQDGEEIGIDDYVTSSGIFKYSVDFQDVLDAWNEEHSSSSDSSDSDTSSD